MTPPAVLAYAGEIGIAGAVRHLTAIAPEVVTMTLDLGQRCDLDEVRDRALAAGAARAHVLDAHEEFVRDFLFPALHAGVPQPGSSVFASALTHALLARKLVEIAAIEGSRSVAHLGCGDAARRLEANVRILDGAIAVSSVPPAANDAADITRPSIGEQAHFASSRSLKTLDTPASLDVAFERGVPVAINGVQMAPVELVESLSLIGEKQGAGRTAVDLLDIALRALEAATVSPDLIRLRNEPARDYAELVCDGRWFTAARMQLDDVNARVQQMVTGTVRVKLFDGKLLSSSVLEDAATVSR